MGAAAIPAGIGLIGGLISNEGQRKAASSAAGQQQQLLDRQKAVFDTINAIRMQGEQAGLFDPKKRMDMIDQQDAKFENLDLGNLAGAMKVSGYRAGDSEIGNRLDAVKLKHKAYRTDQYNEAIRQSFFDHLNAVSAANGGMLSDGINSAQRNQELALSRMQNPTGFIQSLMPYLGNFGGRSGGGNGGGGFGGFGGTNYGAPGVPGGSDPFGLGPGQNG